jgi:hypothetical protein
LFGHPKFAGVRFAELYVPSPVGYQKFMTSDTLPVVSVATASPIGSLR